MLFRTIPQSWRYRIEYNMGIVVLVSPGVDYLHYIFDTKRAITFNESYCLVHPDKEGILDGRPRGLDFENIPDGLVGEK